MQVLFLLFALSLPASAAKTVAVMPFENVTEDSKVDWLTHAVPETITNDLLAIPGLVLVERLQMREVMKEQRFQITGAVDPKTAVEIGKLIGAQVLVLGAFQAFEDQIRLTARFVDVKSGGVLKSAKATGKMKKIFKLQDKLVKDLAENLKLKLEEDVLAKIDVDPTTSLSAYEAFGRGAKLAAENKGREAVAELTKATVLDPKFERAGEKLREVFWSLDPGNTWDYSLVVKIPVVGKTVMETTRRAAGEVEWGGKKAFAYVREGRSRLKGVVGAALGGAKGKIAMTNLYAKDSEGVSWSGYDSSQRNKALWVYLQSDIKAVYDPPFTTFPYNPPEGWKQENTIRVTKTVRTWKVKRGGKLKPFGSNINETTIEKVVVRSLGVEKISVPAGVFEAQVYRVESDGELGGAGRTITFWFAPGIGLVQTKAIFKKVTYAETLEGYSLH